MLGYHGVNVHGSESRNKSMIVHIQNPFENAKPEDLAKRMIGKRIFMGWPFLQEGQVVALSDSLFKYEKMVVTPGTPARVVSNPHAPQGLSHWKTKAERIETYYSKRCGVITGSVDILLHVRPLKGAHGHVRPFYAIAGAQFLTFRSETSGVGRFCERLRGA